MPCMFLKYTEHQKCYNRLDLVIKRMYVSPYEVFNECEFPYLTYGVSPLVQTSPSQTQVQSPSPI